MLSVPPEPLTWNLQNEMIMVGVYERQCEVD
jgi:hypothetical protein